MNDLDDSRLIGMLRRVIRDCRKLYHKSADWMIRRHPTLIQGDAAGFSELMDDLHRGLLIKVYVTIVRADDRWTTQEKRVAAAMIEHLWDQKLAGAELREAATGLFKQADLVSWESLVAPFVRYEPLADSKVQVETIVMRLANLVAKCDGQTMPEESLALHALQKSIDMALHPAEPASTLADLNSPTGNSMASAHAQQQQTQQATEGIPEPDAGQIAAREEKLRTAMAELDQLVGLQAVKDRVRSYTNFLRLQTQRKDAGLATMPISMHMTFVGNPGTGKTTVARIIGQILGAMGTLPRGHVVETDRSGLVAEYAGQTAPKTNKLCDSAIGGVLFIDEAYSLIDASGDDAYGHEAVQTLLKRMEDNRDSMAVILAGYSAEMDQMIRTNPGVSSRINTQIEFEDYAPPDLCNIFESMCGTNQYTLSPEARHRVLIGFDSLYNQRDHHFGNGRLVRNVFEDTVRTLADRIAEITQLSEDLLTSLVADDITFPRISKRHLEILCAKPHQLKFRCDGCEKRVRIKPTSLGRKVRCQSCGQTQPAPWGEVHWLDSADAGMET